MKSVFCPAMGNVLQIYILVSLKYINEFQRLNSADVGADKFLITDPRIYSSCWKTSNFLICLQVQPFQAGLLVVKSKSRSSTCPNTSIINNKSQPGKVIIALCAKTADPSPHLSLSLSLSCPLLSIQIACVQALHFPLRLGAWNSHSSPGRCLSANPPGARGQNDGWSSWRDVHKVIIQHRLTGRVFAAVAQCIAQHGWLSQQALGVR